MTACGFHVAAIEGPAPIRHLGTGPTSGDCGVTEDGTRADRAGITAELVRDADGLRVDVAGLDLCADCASALARLALAPFWRRVLAPAPAAVASSTGRPSPLASAPRPASTPAVGVKPPKRTP
jgi:hypothetical protein